MATVSNKRNFIRNQGIRTYMAGGFHKWSPKCLGVAPMTQETTSHDNVDLLVIEVNYDDFANTPIWPDKHL